MRTVLCIGGPLDGRDHQLGEHEERFCAREYPPIGQGSKYRETVYTVDMIGFGSEPSLFFAHCFPHVRDALLHLMVCHKAPPA